MKSSMKKAPPQPRPSSPQLAVMKNLAAGRPANDHLRGRSSFGAFGATWRSIVARGWVDRDGNLTPAGRAKLGQEVETHGVR